MSILQHMAEDAGTVANSSASAAVVGVSVLGLGLPDWVAIITGVYFTISTGFLILKVRAWLQDRKQGKCSSKD